MDKSIKDKIASGVDSKMAFVTLKERREVMEKVVVLWSMLVFGLSVCSDASAVARFEARDIETKLTELVSLVDIKDAQGIVQRYAGEIKNIANSKPQKWMGSSDLTIINGKVEFTRKVVRGVEQVTQPHQGRGKGDAQKILNEIQREIVGLRGDLEKEARVCMLELEGLGGNPSILGNFSGQGGASLSRALVDEANEEVARLKKEAEQRRQQEEAREKQEAEKRKREEEVRARQEEELNRQREEVRAQQAEEVRLRMQELGNLGGDTSILKEFENGSGDPEKIREYKAALNRADAEIVRLRNESNLNNQSAIDQLTEENQELRGMIEQLMEKMKNMEKEDKS